LRRRAARWPRDGVEVVSTLLAHLASSAEACWRESLHCCGICLDEKSALDCVRFSVCTHTFCKECLTGYFESLMSEGGSSALCCPEPSCRQAVTPSEVQTLLPESLYERYEKQQLQTGLDSMRDVVWCPRCEYPAFLIDGEGSSLANCGCCGFAFCTECRLAWHGLAPCANLATRWRQADDRGKAALREKYGERVIEEVESSEWVLDNTKRCPNCYTSVEKNGGCNHITCRKCNYEWCWLCNGKYMQGHFRNGSCEQFSQDFFDELDLTREDFDANYVVMNHW